MTMLMQSTSSYETVQVITVYEFAICTSPIIYLVPPPPKKKKKILSNLCFSFLQIKIVPREIEDNAYGKFCGPDKVYYGRCANGN